MKLLQNLNLLTLRNNDHIVSISAQCNFFIFLGNERETLRGFVVGISTQVFQKRSFSINTPEVYVHVQGICMSNYSATADYQLELFFVKGTIMCRGYRTLQCCQVLYHPGNIRSK